MTYDPVDANDDGIVEADVDNELVNTDRSVIGQGEIQENDSVVGRNPYDFYATALADDGTYYGLTRDSGDDILYQTVESPSEQDWSEVYRWSNVAGGTNRGLHITASGALLASVDGVIKRSTDGGETWSDRQALTDPENGIWHYTENASGSILCHEYQTGVAIWESTDDGENWTLIDDGTDVSFPTHAHNIQYHPQNDWIIVTGGDPTVSSASYFRSTDGGETWDELSLPETGHFVGIAPHPTDGNKYFLGDDTPGTRRGVWEVEDDGMGVQSATLKMRADFEQSGDATGPFYLTTVEDRDTQNFSFLFGTSVNLDNNLLFASTNLEAANWRAVGRAGEAFPKGWRNGLSQQGAYGRMIDIDRTEYLVGREEWVYLPALQDHSWGSPTAIPMDNRTQPACRVALSSNQPIPQNEWTQIEYDSDTYDDYLFNSLDAFDTSTYQLKPTEDGLYHLEARLTWTSDDSGSGGQTLWAQIAQFNVPLDFDQMVAQQDGTVTQTVSATAFLREGETIRVRARNLDTGGRDLSGSAAQNHFAAYKLY